VCTPESCTQVSRDPVSDQVYGDWVNADGETITIGPIYLGTLEDLEAADDLSGLDVLPTVALVSPVEGESGRLVASDGAHFVEWHVDMQGVKERKRPRRLARVQIVGDRLVWQTCSLAEFEAVQDSMPYWVVDAADGRAIGYTDYAGMYEAMGRLVLEDDFWLQPVGYKRVQ
jgi:hypothetical protein